jgi:hypothetical protein
MGNSFAFARREAKRLSAKAVLSPCRFFKKEAKTLLFRKDAFALWSTGMHAVGIRKNGVRHFAALHRERGPHSRILL